METIFDTDHIPSLKHTNSIHSTTSQTQQSSTSSQRNTLADTSLLSTSDYTVFPENSIRINYFSSLIKQNLLPNNLLSSDNSSYVYDEQHKHKSKYNSIILFDWDDTLLCSTYLQKHNFFNHIQSPPYNDKVSLIEKHVYRLLTIAISLGDTYIITNASSGWVEYSAIRFYPSIVPLLSKVKIISARNAFSDLFPNDMLMWKFMTFTNVANLYNKDIVTNIICVGDSNIEMEAASKMGLLFKEVFIKTIKFKEEPKPEQIIKQLMLISEQFVNIHSEARDISIKVEKKRKPNKEDKNKNSNDIR